MSVACGDVTQDDVNVHACPSFSHWWSFSAAIPSVYLLSFCVEEELPLSPPFIYLLILWGLEDIYFVLWVSFMLTLLQIWPVGSLLDLPFLTGTQGSLTSFLLSGELRCFRLISQPLSLPQSWSQPFLQGARVLGQNDQKLKSGF